MVFFVNQHLRFLYGIAKNIHYYGPKPISGRRKVEKQIDKSVIFRQRSPLKPVKTPSFSPLTPLEFKITTWASISSNAHVKWTQRRKCMTQTRSKHGCFFQLYHPGDPDPSVESIEPFPKVCRTHGRSSLAQSCFFKTRLP